MYYEVYDSEIEAIKVVHNLHLLISVLHAVYSVEQESSKKNKQVFM